MCTQELLILGTSGMTDEPLCLPEQVEHCSSGGMEIALDVACGHHLYFIYNGETVKEPEL